MGIEIERKFLVKKDLWHTENKLAENYQQAYLTDSSKGTDGIKCSVRVRIEGNVAKLNIKSATLGIVRQEFEYPIPLNEAKELFLLSCTSLVTKRRYKIDFAGKTWEVDVFSGDNEGLIVAEIELNHTDEKFELPPWVDKEVSSDPRYYNTELARHPYNKW